MPYTAPTFLQAKTALALRLNDPNKVHWLDAELGVYIIEALRTWNAWTAHWRDQSSFNTTPLTAFYDLPTVLPALRGQTVTNWNLVADLQYALLEPAAAGGTWTGTDQFTLAQLTAAIEGRRDQFLRETGAVLTRTVTAYAAPAVSGRLALNEAVLQVRRAAWVPATAPLVWPLYRTDEWASTHYSPAWRSSSQLPANYSTGVTPPLELQLVPAAAAAGSLDLVSVNKGAPINSAVAASLNIPDDFAWVIKFGALADLLQGDGLALDPIRASYCEQRWNQGIEHATQAAVVLNGQIGALTPVLIDSLAAADKYSPLWQNVSGVPRRLITAGQTLLATWPPPGAVGGPWSIVLDVVRNAPVPAANGDILQVSADVYDTILDYAQHLALFKEGPGELQTALGLLERVMDEAGVEYHLQLAQQPNREALIAQTTHDANVEARIASAAG